MSRTNGMHIAGEMQVNLLHRHHLRITPARGAAFQTEAGTKTGFAQANRRGLTQRIDRITQTDGHGCFTFARRRRTHGRYQD